MMVTTLIERKTLILRTTLMISKLKKWLKIETYFVNDFLNVYIGNTEIC
jgi:hypothetical protein